MFKALLRASLLLAPVVAAQAATSAAELDELHQRQFRYARAMLQLNQLEGFERGPSIDALLQHERDTKAKRAAELGRDPADERAQSMDEFAKAVERVAADQRAERTMSRQWQVDEPYPSHWSISGNEAAASDCARAIEHPLGQPLRIEMNRDGIAWLRVVAPSKGYWAFDTLVSEFDTKLSVYRDCRDIGADAKQISDDTVGLGAIVGLDAKTAGQTFLIKLERKGGVGALAIAKSMQGAYTISGQIARASDGMGLAYVNVMALHDNGSRSFAMTDATGQYSLFVYEPGNYRVRSGRAGFRDLVSMAWPAGHCAWDEIQDIDSCQGSINPIAVAEGTANYVADFALPLGAVVVGLVSDAVSGLPVAGTNVRLYEAWSPPQSPEYGWAITDDLGRFRVSGLPTRSWYVEFAHEMHLMQRWRNTLCGTSCAYQSGDLLTTVLGTTAERVDATLTPAPHLRIRGVVGDVPVFHPGLALYTAAGDHIPELQLSPKSTGVPGEYVYGPIPPGQYRASLYPSTGFGKVVGGADCYDNCSAEIPGGDLIVIPQSGAAVRDVEFRPFGTLAGTVTDPSGAPIDGGTVSIVAENGFVQSTVPIEDGSYRFGNILPYVNIDIVARSPQHVDALLGNIPCEVPSPPVGCSPGTRLSFGLADPAAQTADFVLSRSARIEGRAQSRLWPGALDGVQVIHRLRANGEIAAAYAVFVEGGNYELNDVVTGTNYWALDSNSYVRQIYPGVSCVGAFQSSYATCDLAAAQALQLIAGETRTDVDFDLQPWRIRLLRVVSVHTGLPLAGVGVDQWNTDGTFSFGQLTNAEGWVGLQYLGGDYPAAYAALVSTDNHLGYLDQVLVDTQCAAGTSAYFGTCSLAGAEPVQLFDQQHGFFAPLVIALSLPQLFSNSFE